MRDSDDELCLPFIMNCDRLELRVLQRWNLLAINSNLILIQLIAAIRIRIIKQIIMPSQSEKVDADIVDGSTTTTTVKVVIDETDMHSGESSFAVLHRGENEVCEKLAKQLSLHDVSDVCYVLLCMMLQLQFCPCPSYILISKHLMLLFQ